MVEVLFFLYIFRYLHDQIVTTWCNNRGKLLWWLRRWLHALFYASSNRSTLPPAVQQTQFCFFWNADWCFFSSRHRKLLQIQPQILVVCFFFFFLFSSLWCRSTRYQHHFVGYTPGTLCIIENVKCEMPFNVYCYISWVCNTHYGNCELLHFTVLTGLLYR